MENKVKRKSKNEIRIENQGISPIYYYSRVKFNQEEIEDIATTCLLIDEEKAVIARGIAICSFKDNFNKSKGRSIALGRAIQAYEHHCSLALIRDREFDYGKNFAMEFVASNISDFKAEYAPRITEDERKLVERAVK